MASVISIAYDGVDITSLCVFAECRFEAQMAAIPGTFSVTIKDPDQLYTFTTGKELTLDVDDQRLYGGFVTQVTKKNFFPAVDTTVVADVDTRQWVLTGVDYNVIFDKRVLRHTTNYTAHIPVVDGTHTDAYIIQNYFSQYFDIPSGFDFSDPTYILDSHTFTPSFTWMEQSTTMRDVLENFAIQSGAVYWIDANRQFNYLPVQDTVAAWGFSDNPNNDPIGVGTPTYGFREGSFTEDATAVVNDALVWGGSGVSVSGTSIVFDREQNATSISDHGRWQLAENLVGQDGFKSTGQVTARAKIIVYGAESAGDYQSGSPGLVNPEKQFRCTWFSVDVPEDAGQHVHLRPGQVVPIRLWVFSEDAGATPFSFDVPLRQLSISFPISQVDGTTALQFEGFFGLLMSDPNWLWTFLRNGATKAPTTTIPGAADNSTTNPSAGDQYQDEPSPATNGVTTIFTIPFGYLGGTLQLYVNGLLQDKSTAYSESDPPAGEITLTFAPASGDTLLVEATLLG